MFSWGISFNNVASGLKSWIIKSARKYLFFEFFFEIIFYRLIIRFWDV
jgi:hypothetical protein